MAKSDVEILTEEKLAKGGVLAKLYFDMQHKQSDQLQPLLVELINEHLLKEKGVIYCYGAVEEPMEQNGIFITSASLTMLFENFFPLVNIALNYAPAGIEILRPNKEISFKVSELQSLLMDLSQVSVNYSKYIAEHVLKPEDMADVDQRLTQRLELGKKLLEKKDDKKA
jgi:hypothetical protein